MSYDSLYNKTADYFGDGPEQMLVDHARLLAPALPVLDIGCGQGRNAFFLARSGRRVVAIDPSRAAVETIARTVRDTGLPVEAHALGFEEYRAAAGTFAGVLLFGIIQILERERIAGLAEAVGCWAHPGGLAFITAFSVDDPRFEAHAEDGRRIGRNSFLICGGDAAEGEIRTYLERNEILAIFDSWETIHHWEGLGPEHRHGAGPPERHGRIEAILRKREA